MHTSFDPTSFRCPYSLMQAFTTECRFGPVMHSPHRAIFRRRRPGSGAKPTEEEEDDNEEGNRNAGEDGDSTAGRGDAGASSADDGPGLVDEHSVALRPGLMTNKATWDRCEGLPLLGELAWGRCAHEREPALFLACVAVQPAFLHTDGRRISVTTSQRVLRRT